MVNIELDLDISSIDHYNDLQSFAFWYKIDKKIKNRQLYGELGHPEKFDISLNNVSHVITKIDHTGVKNKVIIKILDTTSGLSLQSHLALGGTIKPIIRWNPRKKQIFTIDIEQEY